MKKIVCIIILNLFCYSSFSISDEIDNNYVKWNVKFESLIEIEMMWLKILKIYVCRKILM